MLITFCEFLSLISHVHCWLHPMVMLYFLVLNKLCIFFLERHFPCIFFQKFTFYSSFITIILRFKKIYFLSWHGFFSQKLICIMAEIFYYAFKEKKISSFSLTSVLESTVLQYKTKCLSLKFNSQL